LLGILSGRTQFKIRALTRVVLICIYNPFVFLSSLPGLLISKYEVVLKSTNEGTQLFTFKQFKIAN
jgi:hypothetical protein